MNKLKLPIWEKALSRAAHAKKRVSEIHKKAKTMLTAFIKPWAGKTKSWISAKAKPVKPYAGKIKAWVSAGLSNIKLTHVGLKQLGILLCWLFFWQQAGLETVMLQLLERYLQPQCRLTRLS